MPLVLGIVGTGRKSGKTSLVEEVTSRLTDKGYNVCTIKHIAEDSFDTPRKDTWRHLRAGASTVIAVTSSEIIRITKTQGPSLKAALEQIPHGLNLVLVEGFKNSEFSKVLIAKNAGEVEVLMGQVDRVVAVTGPIAESMEERAKVPQSIPVIDTDALIPMVERMIVKDFIKSLPGLNCKQCGYPSCEALAQAIMRGEAMMNQCKTITMEDVTLSIDGRRVPLSEFVQTFMRNTITGMVYTLKGVEAEKVRRIVIEIRGADGMG